MYTAGTSIQAPLKSDFLQLNRFSMADRTVIQTYVDRFEPASCEYNFSNLYAWQDAYNMTWSLYQERLLIYDSISHCSFMPVGEDLHPEELVILSLNLRNMGLSPDFSLVTSEYLNKFPDIEKYYLVKQERDYSEYIYNVDSLCHLTGVKLHKKRNLISQFKRSFPDFEVHMLKGDYRRKALELSQELMNRRNAYSETLDQEMAAIKLSFERFEQLGLEGLVITVENTVAAFSVFSPLSPSTYDIQFEKFDTGFKGIGQIINQETAKYLSRKCRYLNREQDLGIKGLRQAKLSYEPVKLLTPYSLSFAPSN